MEYIYASLLLHTAKKEITEDAVKSVLSAAGVEVDEVRVKAVVAALKEVNIDEVLKNATAMPVAAAPAAAPAQEAKKEEKKEEEEKKGPSDEEIAGGLSSLFG
ncbi:MULTISPECIES: 50S ribosomal protein P1 [Metallosphaera]|uniref:Large ribosomal subunit protein P1 n=3 Tax=Metallosphaera TaxID=41980 RepID=A4YH90_METS5|nr:MULTISPECIES: 50S ribosomal protein P1 [Metallosphaera]BCS94140.1 MAG: 50S ribosomal protein P1 [Metallosphaera javensis (ex Sakai et al. 2022)]ABP95792.1 LSU ribosomal protein L12AE [Metallosphaera sedula DSM 5348]AIM27776.1 LSU ribosomal protein L12AE [Metallosphaera sedula]AKV75365.1 50S ribosomal protein L12 [Metallosphaera sedula]AKV77609.1 50S ribosomal protein L12 [Metallosphaera sedula]